MGFELAPADAVEGAADDDLEVAIELAAFEGAAAFDDQGVAFEAEGPGVGQPGAEGSRGQVELEPPEPGPPPRTVRLRIVRDGVELGTEFYGKLLARPVLIEGCFCLRFAGLPPDVRSFFLEAIAASSPPPPTDTPAPPPRPEETP